MTRMPVDTASLREEAKDLLTPTVELRRELHRWPEVGNELPVTQETVLGGARGPARSTSPSTRRRAASPPCSPATGPGPTILLRGDMDALPLHEDTGLDFTSSDDGAMHACGHDTHTAMLAGAAKLLAGRRGDLAGRVLFMFQPGEEGHHGARYMLEEGLLDVPDLADGTPSPVTGAFALHITSSLPSGWLSSRQGSIMASADTLLITITGKGGHASEPHRTIDPIPVACEIVQALQIMVTRSVDVFDPAVVTVGQASPPARRTTSSPRPPHIEGTIRAVSEKTRAKVHDGIRRVADGIAAAHGCDVEVEVEAGYPVTVNDDVVRRPRARPRRRPRRRRQGRAPAAPGDGRRGLELRAAAGPRGDDVPRRHPPRPQPGDRRAEPLQPRRVRRAGDGHRHRRPTPPSPSTTSS